MSAVAGLAATIALTKAAFPKATSFDAARFAAARDAILLGDLKPDSEGVITLPPEFSNLSMTGCAYLESVAAKPLIFFPTSDGRDASHPFSADNWIGGYVFDAEQRAPKRQPRMPESWTLTGPNLEGGQARTTAPRSQPWNVVETRSFGDGWFSAETFS